MPSPARTRYIALTTTASRILAASRESSGRETVRALYGAAFVAEVAGWNAYIGNLVGCFYQIIANPTDAQYQSVHTLANGSAERNLRRFNTPNSDNTRTLLVECTGYDPWPDWNWPAARLSPLEMRQRLDEVLKVRHSLAHGSPMPGYDWTQSPSGVARLDLQSVRWTQAFFRRLVEATDNGLTIYISRSYGIRTFW